MRKWFEEILNGNGKTIAIAATCVLALGLTCGMLAYANTEKGNSNKDPSVSNTSSSNVVKKTKDNKNSSSKADNKATVSNKSTTSSSLNSSSDQSTATASSSVSSVSNSTSKQTEKESAQTKSSANSTTSAPKSDSVVDESPADSSVSTPTEQSSGHTHNWVATQQTIHHDAVVTKEAWDETTYTTDSYAVCNTCGFRDGIDGDLSAHMRDAMASYISENPDIEDGLYHTPHQSFHEEYVDVPHTVHHDAEVTPAWDETITVYICSECGAVQ